MEDIDHKAFVANLSAQQKNSLTQRSTGRGVVHLIGHLGLALACALWVIFALPFWQIVLLPLGIVLVFLFTLEHECTHKTPFAHEGVNEWVGWFCGLVSILPFEWFRYFHLAHHRWTTIIGKDPELAAPTPQAWGPLVLHLSGLPYWYAMIVQLLRNAWGRSFDDFIPPSTQRRVKIEARVYLALFAALLTTFFWSSLLLWVWVIPVLLGQPFLRLYLLAEHGRCAHVPNMFENTRTTFTTSILRFIAWNMPFHVEHHVYPNVPFHNLPKLHVLTRKHLQVTAKGYLKFTRDLLTQKSK